MCGKTGEESRRAIAAAFDPSDRVDWRRADAVSGVSAGTTGSEDISSPKSSAVEPDPPRLHKKTLIKCQMAYKFVRKVDQKLIHVLPLQYKYILILEYDDQA